MNDFTGRGFGQLSQQQGVGVPTPQTQLQYGSPDIIGGLAKGAKMGEHFATSGQRMDARKLELAKQRQGIRNQIMDRRTAESDLETAEQGRQIASQTLGSNVRKERLESVVMASGELQNIPDDQKQNWLAKRREYLLSQGLPTDDTDEAIAMQASDPEGFNAQLDGMVNFGYQSGLLKQSKDGRQAFQKGQAGLQGLVFDPNTGKYALDEIAAKHLNKTEKRELSNKKNFENYKHKQRMELENLKQAANAESDALKKQKLVLQAKELQLKIDKAEAESLVGSQEGVDKQTVKLQETQAGLDLVTELIGHEGRTIASGFQSPFPTVPGTDSADFETKLDTMKAYNFMGNVAKMKGMGALTDVEGKKLEALAGSLNLKQSDKQLLKTLKQMQAVYQTGTKREQEILNRRQKQLRKNTAVLSKGGKYISDQEINRIMEKENLTRDEVINGFKEVGYK